MTEEILLRKYDDLKHRIRSLGSAAVAFSGGVDSAFLMFAAKEALGERTMAVTASVASFPAREMDEACSFCREYGIKQDVIKLDQLSIEGFSRNPEDRCYICKHAIFGKICDAAKREGLDAVIEGSNVDDEGDYRPGARAIAELGVKSPLRDAGFTKEEIRAMSRRLGLPTWDKPSFACLATRFPYGDEITGEKLIMADRAEQLLIDLGFSRVRVRIHGNIARIELDPVQFEKFMEEKNRRYIYEEFRKTGFTYVTLDIAGYRTGSMNEALGRRADE